MLKLFHPLRCLRKVSLAVPLTSVVVNGFEIFESSRPHTQWGIPHIGKKLSGNANLQMTSLPSSGLCQYSSSKSEKQSQNHSGPGSLLTAISQQGCRSPSVGVGGDKNMVRTVDSGDISTSGDSGIQIIKAVGTLSTTHNSSDNSSSVAALMPSSITPMASPCEEPTALPGMMQRR